MTQLPCTQSFVASVLHRILFWGDQIKKDDIEETREIVQHTWRRMTDESWTGKNLEESNRRLIQVLPILQPGSTEEDH
jgi:hypothetical protein